MKLYCILGLFIHTVVALDVAKIACTVNLGILFTLFRWGLFNAIWMATVFIITAKSIMK